MLFEQTLKETAGDSELCRRYNIASDNLYIWERRYVGRKLDPRLFREADLEVRIREPARLQGKVASKNELLKKPYPKASNNSRKSGIPYRKPRPHPKHWKGVRTDETAHITLRL